MALFGSTPASPTFADPPVTSTAPKLRPLRLSTSHKPATSGQERPLPFARRSAQRISKEEEIEEEEDRLQLKRVVLLQDQLQEESTNTIFASPSPHRPLLAQRRRSGVSPARTCAWLHLCVKKESLINRWPIALHPGESPSFPLSASATLDTKHDVTVRPIHHDRSAA